MPTTESTAQPKRLQCRHIFTEGRRCGSPCLRGEDFCYYHHTSRKPVPQLSRRRARQGAFTLPMPEDRAAVQLSIGEVLARIAQNQLDPRRAGLLLYGLQIALQSLPKPIANSTSNKKHAQKQPQPQPHVEEIVLHPTHGLLAPEAEFQKDPADKTLEDILLEQWARYEEKEEVLQQQATQPITLPDLQASTPALRQSTPRSTSNPHPCKTLNQKVRGGQGTRRIMALSPETLTHVPTPSPRRPHQPCPRPGQHRRTSSVSPPASDSQSSHLR